MKTTHSQILIAATLVVGALAFATTSAHAEDIETRIGKLSFTHDFANGYPTKETVTKLYDERDFQRACQLYLWALPMVSFGEVEHVLMDAPGSASGDIIRVDTVPGRGWCGGFRLYGPTQAFFDKTWKPDDIVKVK